MPGRIMRRAAPLLGALFVVGAFAAAWTVRKSVVSDSPEQTARLRAHTPAGMTLIPGGESIAGSDDPDADDDVRPKRRELIPAFYIDLHEVTNREFQKFDRSRKIAPGEEDMPANGITYEDAAAYAHWAGKRLPTEAEWEKAARGTDGRRYPWGDTWDLHRVAPRRRRAGDSSIAPPPAGSKLCAVGPSRLQRVGSRPEGASPYGCFDMAGNAWEWVQGFYNGDRSQRILRGGAVGYGERACRTYTRSIEGAADT